MEKEKEMELPDIRINPSHREGEKSTIKEVELCIRVSERGALPCLTCYAASLEGLHKEGVVAVMCLMCMMVNLK